MGCVFVDFGEELDVPEQLDSLEAIGVLGVSEVSLCEVADAGGYEAQFGGDGFVALDAVNPDSDGHLGQSGCPGTGEDEIRKVVDFGYVFSV